MGVLVAGLLLTAAAAAAVPYTTTIGGSGMDQGWSVAVDSSGNAWIAGLTYSADFPSPDSFKGGGTDAFVAKFDSNGNLLWSRILGGNSSDGTVPNQTPAIAVDSSGNAWVAGSTFSMDFPVIGEGGPCGANVDIFVAKLDPYGVPVFSGCFGGPYGDTSSGIAVDVAGNAWVTGSANGKAFLLGLDSSGRQFSWNTLGGSNGARGAAVATGSTGIIYVAGVTGSADFPVTTGPGCALNSSGYCYDAFLVAFNPGAAGIVFATLAGTTSLKDVHALSLDQAGNSYIAGDFQAQGQPEHGFIASLDPQGRLRYFTKLQGENRDAAMGVVPDRAGNAWVAGWSMSDGLFPGLRPDVYGSAFLTRLNPSGDGFWCTQRLGNMELRGLALDSQGLLYLTGLSAGFPPDGWLSRMADSDSPQITITLTPASVEPVNHKLADIGASITVSDFCDPAPKVSLVSIVSSEPDDGLGDGDKPNDIQEAEFGSDDRQFKVRAERSGSGPGRIYTVTYRVTDSAGNSTDAVATVTVRPK